jgi:hypothetical protein
MINNNNNKMDIEHTPIKNLVVITKSENKIAPRLEKSISLVTHDGDLPLKP